MVPTTIGNNQQTKGDAYPERWHLSDGAACTMTQGECDAKKRREEELDVRRKVRASAARNTVELAISAFKTSDDGVDIPVDPGFILRVKAFLAEDPLPEFADPMAGVLIGELGRARTRAFGTPSSSLEATWRPCIKTALEEWIDASDALWDEEMDDPHDMPLCADWEKGPGGNTPLKKRGPRGTVVATEGGSGTGNVEKGPPRRRGPRGTVVATEGGSGSRR